VAFDIRNDEDEPVVVSLTATIIGTEQGLCFSFRKEATLMFSIELRILWLADKDKDEESDLPTHSLGQLLPGQLAKKTFQFTAPINAADSTIDISAQYYLISDPETPVSKAVTLDLPVVDPFAATFDFSPRVHPTDWPSYFSINPEEAALVGKDKLEGLWQRWCLTANLTNQATDTLIIKNCTISLSSIYPENAAISAVSRGNVNQEEREILFNKSFKVPFWLDIRRRALEDRRALGMDASLNLEWRRVGSDIVNKTALTVPRLPVPACEPRVLASKFPPVSIRNSAHEY
jgi:trafficking protein particle complex subunit 11